MVQGTDKKDRVVGLEVLRVVSMLLIIFAHFCGWGTTHNNVGPIQVSFSNGGVNSYLFVLLGTISAMGVICFIMTTGYFICESNVLRLDKLFKIWFQTMFYSVILTLVASFFITVPVKKMLLSFTPIGTDSYWFVTKYLALLLLAPFMSIIVNSISRKGMLVLLAVLSCLTVTITCGIPYGNVFFQDNPLSISVFVLIFFIAAYIKRFGVPDVIEHNCGIIFWICVILQTVVGIILNIVRIDNNTLYGGFSVGYNAFSLVPATAFFIWFKNHRFSVNWFVGLLCKLAPFTFAVYLIHDNPYIRSLLWNSIIDPAEYWQTLTWIVLAVIVPVIILLLCSAVDYMRDRLFALLRVDKLANCIGRHNITIK